MTNDYEVRLQDWLARCGGDWECLARVLFFDHPIITAVREAKEKQIKRSFRIGRKDRYIRSKSWNEVAVMISRLRAAEVGTLGQRRFSSRKAALREGLKLKGAALHEWEKILAIHFAREKYALESGPSMPLIALADLDSSAEYPHDDNCPGCHDCQGVD